MRLSPCKGCEKRTVRPNCHDACPEYIDFTAVRARCKEQKMKESKLFEYIKQARQRTAKRR